MSRHVLSRIPLELCHTFRIYEFLSKKFVETQNSEVSVHLRKASSFDSMQTYWRMNVANDHTQVFNPADFPPMLGQLVAPIFQNHLVSTADNLLHFLEGDSITEPLISLRNHTFKHFTDYQARMLLSFASSLSPYDRVPLAKTISNSFKWYQRLLTNTPIIIFLAQRQKLMSEPSLLSINPPFENFRIGVSNLSSKQGEPGLYRKNIKSYHLTDLASSDLFRLALKSGSEEWLTLPFEKDLSITEDKLYQQITKLQRPRVIDANGNERDFTSLQPLLRKYPIQSFHDSFLAINDPKEVYDYFPYDIVYNDIYVLTIESPVIEDCHEDLLRLIQSQSQFEVFAIRISPEFPLQKALGYTGTHAGDGNGDATKNFNATYDDLLTWAREQHERESRKLSGSALLMQNFGQWGLVEVAQSKTGSFYLFK